MLRAAIVDDNSLWRRRESASLLTYADEHNLELECVTYGSCSELVGQQVAPDVLFSDIELEGGESGIDLVHVANELWPDCQVVYVTNHLHYAPEVYSTKHLWFVLKDQFDQRLPEIMQKLLHQFEERDAMVVLNTTARELVSLRCSEIVYVERNTRITNVYITDGTVYQVHERVAVFMGQMPPHSFGRSHGSYAVNLSHVREIGADTIRTTEGWEIPLSRRFARSFKESFLVWADEHAV